MASDRQSAGVAKRTSWSKRRVTRQGLSGHHQSGDGDRLFGFSKNGEKQTMTVTNVGQAPARERCN